MANGARLVINLGFFESTKAGKKKMAETILKVRRTLDAKRLKVASTDVADATKRHVEIVLKADEYPEV